MLALPPLCHCKGLVYLLFGHWWGIKRMARPGEANYHPKASQCTVDTLHSTNIIEAGVLCQGAIGSRKGEVKV